MQQISNNSQETWQEESGLQEELIIEYEEYELDRLDDMHRAEKAIPPKFRTR